MKQLIKRILVNSLLKRNIRMGMNKTTEQSKILEFLALMRPVKTNHELVRMGGETDGGYLVPNDLENIDICFSPGVSKVADFEADLTKKGIKCFLADYSVQAPPFRNALFDFEKKFIGAAESDMCMTLESWVRRKAPDSGDFILQMDIEGAEYEVILDTSSETLRRFRIVVVEFHGLDGLTDKMSYQLINLTFRKILKDFEIVHIHPNNCIKPIRYGEIIIPPIMEFTFLRKDRITSRRFVQTFPHRLDKRNVPHKEDFALPKCWYGQSI